MEEQLFPCIQVQDVFQVDSDIEARATAEKGDLQKPSLVDNAPVRVSEQIHFFNLFSVLEQPTWLVLGDARNAAKPDAEPHLLVVGIQST